MPPQFDIEEYARTRHAEGASLSALHAELTQKHSALRGSLRHLLREHHGDLLGLSGRLSGVDQAVSSAHQPLKSIIAAVQATQTSLDAQQREITQKLAYRAQVRERRALLRVLLDIAQLLDRAEALLADLAEGSAAAPEALERAAYDVAQIKYYVAKAADAGQADAQAGVMAQAGARMHNVEQKLVGALEQTLAQSMQDLVGDKADGGRVAQCLRAFDAADMHVQGTRALAALVRPLLALHDTLPGRGMGLDAAGFSKVLQGMLAQCSRLGGPLRKASTDTAAAAVAQVLWREAAQALYDGLPLVFVPAAQPAAFHANYTEAGAFVTRFARAFGVDARDAMFGEFQRKWQVAAYFAVRRSEIIDTVEQPGTPAVERAEAALRRCWDDDVVLPPIAARLWQLSLQLVRWAKDPLAADHAAAADEAEHGAAEALALARDVHRLRQCADGLLPRVCAMLAECSAQTQELLRAAVGRAFAPLDALAGERVDAAAGAMVAASCAALPSHLRRTTSQYRHTGRAAPQRASAYVAHMFAGLPAAAVAQQDAGSAGQRLRDAVCVGVSAGMAHAVAEALATISRTEASLRRLRGAGRADDANDNAAVPPGLDLRGTEPGSDNDKIRRQIWIDMDAAARAIAGLGARPHDDFSRLLREMAPLGV